MKAARPVRRASVVTARPVRARDRVRRRVAPAATRGRVLPVRVRVRPVPRVRVPALVRAVPAPAVRVPTR